MGLPTASVDGRRGDRAVAPTSTAWVEMQAATGAIIPHFPPSLPLPPFSLLPSRSRAPLRLARGCLLHQRASRAAAMCAAISSPPTLPPVGFYVAPVSAAGLAQLAPRDVPLARFAAARPDRVQDRPPITYGCPRIRVDRGRPPSRSKVRSPTCITSVDRAPCTC